MKRTALILLLLVLAAAWPGAAPAADDELFSRLEKAASRVESLQSAFIQEKHLEMFREVLVSKGRFSFQRPDRLRWEVTEPVAAGFVIKGKEGKRWSGRLGSSEPFSLEKDSLMKMVAGQLLAWARADFGALRKEYRIIVSRDDPAALRLEPLSAGGPLEYFLISFAPGGGHLETAEIHEKGGDFTRIRFTDTAVNIPLPENLF